MYYHSTKLRCGLGIERKESGGLPRVKLDPSRAPVTTTEYAGSNVTTLDGTLSPTLSMLVLMIINRLRERYW